MFKCVCLVADVLGSGIWLLVIRSSVRFGCDVLVAGFRYNGCCGAGLFAAGV